MKKLIFRNLVVLVFVLMITTPSRGKAQEHAFLWSSETGMQDLGTNGAVNSSAYAVNDSGEVVGGNFDPEGFSTAFLWNASDGMIDLGAPIGYQYSLANGINRRGEVCGYAFNTNGASVAFYWSTGTGFKVFEPIGYCLGYGINDAAKVVGERSRRNTFEATFWIAASGAQRGIGFLPGNAEQSIGYDINNSGNIVGRAETAQGILHPFFWSSASGMIDLGVISPGDYGEAYSVNDHDEVVGGSFSTGEGTSGFYWSADAGLVKLFPVNEHVSVVPAAINNRGMIAGTASGGTVTRAVVYMSYLSKPIYLGHFPGGSVSFARGMNNLGQVVGAGYID